MAETTTTTLEQQRVPTPEEFNAVIRQAQGGGNRILPAKETAEPSQTQTVFERTVVINGQSLKFQGLSPESVLDQVSAAVTAAGTVKPAAAAQTVETKPVLTEKDLFDIGVKLQKGDATALDEYLDKSDYVGRKLAEQGINVAELKQATKVALDSQTAQSWEAATAEFLKTPGNDWPGGEHNHELLGMMIARLGLNKQPSAANIQRAYDELKTKGMLFPVNREDGKQPPVVRRQTSSTAFGTGGRTETRTAPGSGPSISKSAFDNAKSQSERDAMYNRFIREGGDPKKPNWVA